MNSEPGFFQLFAQGGKGGQNEIVWIIGGASMYLCAKCAAGGMLPWDFRTFITRNLVKSGTVSTHNITIYKGLN